MPMHFAIFPLHLSKVLRLPRKSDARSYEVLHLDAPKCNPLSGNQRPDLLTALVNMSLVPRLPRKMHLCRAIVFGMLQNPLVLLTLGKVHNPLRVPCETISERPRVVRTPGVFSILTSKCASRHNGVHFFDIATSKSGPAEEGSG